MKVIFRIIHFVAIVCAVLMIGLRIFDWFQLNGFNILQPNALGRIVILLVALFFGALVLWKSAFHKTTSLNSIIIVHLIWSIIFVVFFLNQYRFVTELHSFEPESYREEYLKGVAMLIIAFVFWIGLFSIGPILKARDMRHESKNGINDGDGVGSNAVNLREKGRP
jgi:hypothetical protein